ncbi:hypothetical protein ACHAWF_004432 [Thalassiosira exigua]
MACLPYPTFLRSPTGTPSATSLAAVGRVRLHPLTCPGLGGDEKKSTAASEEYRAIVAKCAQQCQVDVGDGSDKEAAKLRKRYMKEGVALASSYLENTCGIDVSIIDVEVVLSAESVLDTDGCLACCFLDAGCSHVVIRVKDDEKEEARKGLDRALEACDAARIPRERLILHWKEGRVGISQRMDEITARAGTISVQVAPMTSARTGWGDLPTSREWKCVVQLEGVEGLTDDDAIATVASLSKAVGENRGRITLVDPTVERLGLSYAACLRTDRPDGLFTTVVCTRSNEALGLVYSSKASIVAALQCGRGVYHSRSRGGLWRKGDTSGHYQTLHRIDADCDADALRFTVTQNGEDVKAFCHLNTLSCWGEPTGLRHLEGTLAQRLRDAPAGSYTKRLFDDDVLLRDKLVEEAQELSEATTRKHVAEELADVLYFAMVRAAKAGVSIDDAVSELDKRARKVTRRKGDSKVFRIKAGEENLGKK